MQPTILSLIAALLAVSATAMPASSYTNGSTPDAPTDVGRVRITFDVCSDAVLELADAMGLKIGYTNSTIVSRDENHIVMHAVPSDAEHDDDTAVENPYAVSPKLKARQSDETPSYNVDLNALLLTATFELTLDQVDVPEAASEDAGGN
ncbi:hypothetical protein LTR56_000544 [Elasticomyces elasticus]|nr:hypothetical protein LTR56_000544 [Elasticomyces elasticus]KAK3664320.1 hypothetical protein LTR22_004733 [Elasticomyces elasticus]KAK4915430.1 hypothetical protein LTR49_016418 [Elasticomyces elasticus]KAK5752813.1 hypothetical protein LTS12_017092 [Elasticomyces elasticus]